MELCHTADVLYFLHGTLQQSDAEFRFGKMARNSLVLLASCYDVCLYSKSRMLYLIQFALRQKYCYLVTVAVVIHATVTFFGRTGTTFPTNVTLWNEIENIPHSGEGLDILNENNRGCLRLHRDLKAS